MGIEPEYMMSLFYPGYNANGDLSSGFGGGGVLWYKDGDDNCQFGAAGTGFRAYLECMKDWYSRGWICNTFNEDTSPFYQIDLDLVAGGTVPLWMGGSNFGTAIQSSEPGYEAAAGAVVYLAATPINDIPDYDGNPSTSDYSAQATAEEAKEAMNGGSGSEYMLQIPTCLFQAEDFAQGVVVSKAAAEGKDMEVLMRFFDFLYSEEGSVLTTLGLNAEQAEGIRYYEDYGLTNGAYTVNSDGTYTFDQTLEQNVGGIRNAMVAGRIPGIRCERPWWQAASPASAARARSPTPSPNPTSTAASSGSNTRRRASSAASSTVRERRRRRTSSKRSGQPSSRTTFTKKSISSSRASALSKIPNGRALPATS